MDIYDIMCKHQSVRKYLDKEVEDEKLQKLYDVFRQGPSSVGLFQSSLIVVKDEKIKEEISRVCTQDYVKDAPVLFIFLVDLNRNSKLLDEMGEDGSKVRSLDKYLQGFTDAIIGAQSIEVLAESMGLGCVYLGSILNDYDKIIELLHIPKYTFPAVGMAMGYSAEPENLKPKMENNARIFTDKYEEFDSYKDEIKDFSDELKNYSDSRSNGRNGKDFFEQIKRVYSSSNEKREALLAALKRQGFKVEC